MYLGANICVTQIVRLEGGNRPWDKVGFEPDQKCDKKGEKLYARRPISRLCDQGRTLGGGL